MRLIDAVALLEKCYFGLSGDKCEVEWVDVKSMIENAPTVDAVEVVRCKDCKWHVAVDQPRCKCYCDLHKRSFPAHFYCADGERRKY